jgi:hypothetical protein
MASYDRTMVGVNRLRASRTSVPKMQGFSGVPIALDFATDYLAHFGKLTSCALLAVPGPTAMTMGTCHSPMQNNFARAIQGYLPVGHTSLASSVSYDYMKHDLSQPEVICCKPLSQ